MKLFKDIGQRHFIVSWYICQACCLLISMFFNWALLTHSTTERGRGILLPSRRRKIRHNLKLPFFLQVTVEQAGCAARLHGSEEAFPFHFARLVTLRLSLQIKSALPAMQENEAQTNRALRIFGPKLLHGMHMKLIFHQRCDVRR